MLMLAGMLVNHLAKRHPEVPPTAVPELNLPILKTTKDFYCQYCDKVETGAISPLMLFDSKIFPQVYKSSSKRKSHILKNHPGAALPAGAREVSSGQAEPQASTFSHTVNRTFSPCFLQNAFFAVVVVEYIITSIFNRISFPFPGG